MKKASLFLFGILLIPSLLSGCKSKGDSSKPKGFTPHELKYGGDTKETLTIEEFLSYCKDNYQKTVKYWNGYISITSDQPFYCENDPDNLFENINEFRAFAVLNSQERDFMFDGLFEMTPLSFDESKVYLRDIMNYRAYGAYYALRRLIKGRVDESKYEIHKYKVFGDGFACYFSKDYYLTKAVIDYEGATFTMKIKYFNVDDLSKVKGNVDKETFLLHAITRANQLLKFNHAKIHVDLYDAITNSKVVTDPETGESTHRYTRNSGFAEAGYKLDSLGRDKTSYLYYYDTEDRIYNLFGDINYSDNFNEEEKDYIGISYLGLDYAPSMPQSSLFDSYDSISAAAYSPIIGLKIEKKFTVSPLAAEDRWYRKDETTGEYEEEQFYKYEFDDNGLLTSYYCNYHYDDQNYSEYSYQISYTNV